MASFIINKISGYYVGNRLCRGGEEPSKPISYSLKFIQFKYLHRAILRGIPSIRNFVMIFKSIKHSKDCSTQFTTQVSMPHL